jgi:hypothetical protein
MTGGTSSPPSTHPSSVATQGILTSPPDPGSTGSITSSIPESTDTLEGGPLQTPPFYTAPADELTTLSPEQSTASSNLFPNLTTAWPNSTSITNRPEPPPTSDPPCEGRGCNANTNTSKTETTDDQTSTTDPTNTMDYPGKPTCNVTLEKDDPGTTWLVLPNTETVTLTITGNLSTTFSNLPEFTPPSYCWYPADGVPFPTTSVLEGESTGLDVPVSSTKLPWGPHAPTTYITTSKNPVTVFTTETPPAFPSLPGSKTDKVSITPSKGHTDTAGWGLQPPPPYTVPDSTTLPLDQLLTQSNGVAATPKLVTAVVSGVSMTVAPTQVIVGGHTVGNGAPITTFTENDQTFTVNPSQIIGPGTVIDRPPINGGISIPTATPTVIAGVHVQLGPSAAVIGGTTYSIGAGAPERTAVVDGQTISIGPDGLGFAQTTVAPPALPTHVVVLDGQIISVIGSSKVVIEGSTFFYGPASSPQTNVFNGEMVTIGPSGVSFGSSVLGGLANPSGTQLGVAGGLSVTEMGASIAIIGGTTFIAGPGATSTTAVINGKTITVDESGLTIGGATLPYPFNRATEAIVAGGITFSEIGPSLIDIGGTTFTVGPDAKTTTNVYNGQTISLGPGGVGFKTTTVSATAAPTPEPSPTKKNGAGGLRLYRGVFGICIILGAWYNIWF